MPNIVEQRRRSHDCLIRLGDGDGVFGLAKERQRPSRQVVGAERVLEPGVGGSGINEVGPTELPDVPKTLEYVGVDKRQRQVIDADVVPDGIAQNLEAPGPSLAGAFRQPFGPAFLIAASTFSNFSKLSRNIAASFFACAS